MNIKSQILGRYINVSIILPSDFYSYCELEAPARDFGANVALPRYTHVYKPGMKFQVVYIPCAGAPDDEMELDYTRLVFYAQRNHVILVMPDLSATNGVNT